MNHLHRGNPGRWVLKEGKVLLMRLDLGSVDLMFIVFWRLFSLVYTTFGSR